MEQPTSSAGFPPPDLGHPSLSRTRLPQRCSLIPVQSSGLCTCSPFPIVTPARHLSQAPPPVPPPADTLLPFSQGARGMLLGDSEEWRCSIVPWLPRTLRTKSTPGPGIQGPPGSVCALVAFILPPSASLCLHPVPFQPRGATCHFSDAASASEHQPPCQSPSFRACDPSSVKPSSPAWEEVTACARLCPFLCFSFHFLQLRFLFLSLSRVCTPLQRRGSGCYIAVAPRLGPAWHPCGMDAWVGRWVGLRAGGPPGPALGEVTCSRVFWNQAQIVGVLFISCVTLGT